MNRWLDGPIIRSENLFPHLQFDRVHARRFVFDLRLRVFQEVVGEGRLGGVGKVGECRAGQGMVEKRLPVREVRAGANPPHRELQELVHSLEHRLADARSRNVVMPHGRLLISGQLARREDEVQRLLRPARRCVNDLRIAHFIRLLGSGCWVLGTGV